MEASPPETVPGSFPTNYWPAWSGGGGSLYDLSIRQEGDPEPPPSRPIGFIIFKDK